MAVPVDQFVAVELLKPLCVPVRTVVPLGALVLEMPLMTMPIAQVPPRPPWSISTALGRDHAVGHQATIQQVWVVARTLYAGTYSFAHRPLRTRLGNALTMQSTADGLVQGATNGSPVVPAPVTAAAAAAVASPCPCSVFSESRRSWTFRHLGSIEVSRLA